MKRANVSINCKHRVTLVNFMGRVPVGGGTVTVTPEEDFDLRNLAGAINAGAAAPGGCDSTVDIKQPIPFGDFDKRTWQAATDVIVSFPFTMPAKGVTHLMPSESGGQPWARLLTVSTVAGDLNSPVRSEGKVPDIFLTPGQEFPAGTPLFANNVLTQEPTVPNSSGSGFSIVWPAP